MKGFGIAALVISIIAIFIPIVGAFLAGIAGVLAFVSAGAGTSFGLAAVIINTINIIFLSPSLILGAAHQTHTNSGTELSNWFGVLLLIQIVAICIFIVKWFLSRRQQVNA